MDQTRLVAQAAAWNPADDTWVKGGCDIMAFNEYFGVFYGKLSELSEALDDLHSRYPDAPLLITEFGIWSGGAKDETIQANYYNESWRILSSKSYIYGVNWWTAFDYDSMIVFNTFGAVDWYRGHKKELFQAIREAYSGSRTILDQTTQPLEWTSLMQVAITLCLIIPRIFLLLRIVKVRIVKASRDRSSPKLRHGVLMSLIVGVYILLGIVCLIIGLLIKRVAETWFSEFISTGWLLMGIGIIAITLGIVTYFIYSTSNA